MIVDGVEVLYTMRNGKIVDPNIPTDGLVCYLDTRGKNNTDKHKGTLLDLSGNGNNGTLWNFAFTDESGYVNDLSVEGASGLQFDGVDDDVTTSLTYTSGHPYSYMVDFYHVQLASSQGAYVHIGGGVYIHYSNDYIYIWGSATRVLGVIDLGEHSIIVRCAGNINTTEIWIDGTKRALLNNITNKNQTDITLFGGSQVGNSQKIIKKAMWWNRVLTDEEITQLMEV